jgi:hypothetical protein
LLEGKKGITKRTRGRREEKSRSRFQTPGDGWENAVIFLCRRRWEVLEEGSRIEELYSLDQKFREGFGGARPFWRADVDPG